MDNVKFYPWRPVLFVMGCVAGGVSAYSAYYYAVSRPGSEVLALAAPTVAIAVAIIPPAIKRFWKEEIWLCLAMLVTLVVSAGYAFYILSEMSHERTAGVEAERRAKVLAASRAESTLKETMAKLTPQIQEAEAKAKWNPNCQQITSCRNSLAIAASIRQEIEQAEARLAEYQAKAISEPPYKMPPWLLGAAVDLCAFVFLWAGLTGPWWKRESVEYQERLVSAFARWLARNRGKPQTEASVSSTTTS